MARTASRADSLVAPAFPLGPASNHMKSQPVFSAMTPTISINRRGWTPSRSQVRQLAAGSPQATAASLTFQSIRCLTSARRAPNVESSIVHPDRVRSPGEAVIATSYDS